MPESQEDSSKSAEDKVNQHSSPVASALNTPAVLAGKGSMENSASSGLREYAHAKPPNFSARMQRWLFDRGLADMPLYLKEIYVNIPRYVFVNYSLPPDMLDEHGYPIFNYPRNKIRTTKYTPINFIPKNLLLQFRNAANAYFLMLVILGAFQIFGVSSPGMAAVPLIVIVVITAVRDAFEDSRRGSSDSELNNSPIHLLTGWHNPNVISDHISGWRRFKKKSTRVTHKVGRVLWKGCIMTFGKRHAKQEYLRKEAQDYETSLRRVSTVISDYSIDSARPSMGTERTQRKSAQYYKQPKDVSNSIYNPTVGQDQSGPAAKFKNRKWKDITVGDFIRLYADEEVPADMVVLSSSDIDANCYVETKNLDGETNLKTKKALSCGGNTHVRHSRDLANTKFWIECDAPNSQLYSFKGAIHYENYNKEGRLVSDDEKESITIDNLLLRGSTLRNTKWIMGVVVYTGDESKIMLNSGVTPTKVSRISRELNLSVFINFALLFVLCLISGVINGVFYDRRDTSRTFFEFKAYSSTAAGNGVLAFFVALIIYQSLVPISLYISVEIIKTCQAFFIFSDSKMYYEKLDYRCIPKSWNISDDLGQIEYVFSDKTGTLTQNVMEFKKCTIGGKAYGLAYTEAKQGMDKRDGLDVVAEQQKWAEKIEQDKERMFHDLVKYTNNDQLLEDKVTFVSSAYTKDTFEGSESSKQKNANETFMLALALCHTVVTETSDENPDVRIFKAESPDESALVSAARDVGIVFKDRQRNHLRLDVYGEERKYEVLEIIPFSSDRKRMSAILKTSDGKILLICKGADNVIYQRLAENNSQDVTSKTALHLEDFAKEGLRTLCISQKEVDPKYFSEWQSRYREAKSSIDEDREEKIEKVSTEIETDLILLGGTAIEDKLQAGVPDSIAILGQAGVKVWVLTGDRIETAINIGFSCNLLNNNMKMLVVRPDAKDPGNLDYVDSLVTRYLEENFDFQADFSALSDVSNLVKEAQDDHSVPETNFALIIDGDALEHVFETGIDGDIDEKHQILRKKFLLLGKQCKSVICCRASATQKALVTRLVKDGLKVMTLAIGDGANDVPMIQAANVGVGIAGEEGRQAVMSADYAVGQFRFLTRLLLVHGRWSYKRLAEMVPCFFYKNVVFTFTCFWYGIYSDFDGSYLYEYTFLMFYNLAFTSLPIIFLAVLDQDVSDTVSLLVPQLYRSGILRQDWSQYKFMWYMFDGVYQSVIAYFFVYLTFYVGFQNEQGLPVDHRFWQGVIVVCICVVACNLYVLFQQYRWDWLSLLIVAISILLVFFWTGVWSVNTYADEFYRAGAQTLGTLSLWCTIFIASLICLLPRFTYDFLKRNLKPRDVDIIRESVRLGQFDNYPEGYDPTDINDIEKHRLLKELYATDPEAQQKLEMSYIHRNSSSSSNSLQEKDHENPLTKTFKTIKRRATIQRSRGNTVKEDINNQFRRPIDISKLRAQMAQTGQYNTAGRNSLDRITTTHELPGLTQAETLMSYHTRTSINFDHH